MTLPIKSLVTVSGCSAYVHLLCCHQSNSQCHGPGRRGWMQPRHPSLRMLRGLVPSPVRNWGLGVPLPLFWVELVTPGRTAPAQGHVPFSQLLGYASNPVFPIVFVAVSGLGGFEQPGDIQRHQPSCHVSNTVGERQKRYLPVVGFFLFFVGPCR